MNLMSFHQAYFLGLILYALTTILFQFEFLQIFKSKSQLSEVTSIISRFFRFQILLALGFSLALFFTSLVILVSDPIRWVEQMNFLSLAILVILLFLFFHHLQTCLRFGGNFNGGSDYFYFHISLGYLVTTAGIQLNNLYLIKAGFFWIALQLTLSYFLSGISKLKNKGWWNGKVFRDILLRSHYSVPIWFQARSFQKLSAPLSWSVLIFEVFFPLVWFLPHHTLPVLFVGVLFHLGVFWAYGLNRFFWVWTSSYPILLFVVSSNRGL